MRLRVLTTLLLGLASCSSTHSLQGPPADLHALATPTPAPVVVTLPRHPPAQAGRWQIWIPPHTTEHGERVDGHFTSIELAPPVIPEALPPAKPMPMAPKYTPRAKEPEKPKAVQGPAAESMPKPALPTTLIGKKAMGAPLIPGMMPNMPLPELVQ